MPLTAQLFVVPKGRLTRARYWRATTWLPLELV